MYSPHPLVVAETPQVLILFDLFFCHVHLANEIEALDIFYAFYAYFRLESCKGKTI